MTASSYITSVFTYFKLQFYLFQLPGSPAEIDGKLQKGDFIVSVDGKDVSSAEFLAIGAILKLCNNKTNIKVKRFKIVPR